MEKHFFQKYTYVTNLKITFNKQLCLLLEKSKNQKLFTCLFTFQVLQNIYQKTVFSVIIITEVTLLIHSLKIEQRKMHLTI